MTRRNSSPFRFLFVAACYCVVANSPTWATDLYIAPDGSDANSGTRRKPFATLERAREEIRRLKLAARTSPDARSAPQGFTVWLNGGDYPRTNTFELEEADSGAPGAPIVWRAV